MNKATSESNAKPYGQVSGFEAAAGVAGVRSILGSVPSGEDSDLTLGLMELRRDPMYRRIPEERRVRYAERSLSDGYEAVEAAERLAIGELLERAGIAVRFDGSSGGLFGSALRAQIDWTGKVPRIVVYRESMRQLAEAASAFPGTFGELTAEAAADIHLAHEYYHWLEYTRGVFTAERLDPVEIRFGPWKRRASVRQCGEIAAHAFAKRLLKLPHLPNLLDYLYLMHIGELNKEAFDEEMEKCREASGSGRRHMV